MIDTEAHHATSREPRPNRATLRRLRTGAAAALTAVLVAAPAAGATSARPAVDAAAAASSAAARQNSAPLLRLGDTGASVAAWQRQLNLLARSNVIAVDGLYGTSTEQTTANFQRFFGLPVDGFVDQTTRDVMRFMLGAARMVTVLATYDDRSIVGYPGEAAYCVEIRVGVNISVECPAIPRGAFDGQTVTVDGLDEPQLLGSFGSSVETVVIDTPQGPRTADITRSVQGLDRSMWVSPVPPSQVDVVRALAADGSEVRRLVIDDATAYLVLERGDRGPAVTRWQERINALTAAGLTTDGVFGERVVQATMNFQRFFGLSADGVVGPETRDTMSLIETALAQQRNGNA